MALLLLIAIQNNRMQQEGINRYCFLGEVSEVFHQDGQRWMRTLCKPGSILIQILDDNELQLGDSVRVTCSLKVEKLEKQID